MSYITRPDQEAKPHNLFDVVHKALEIEASALLALRRSPPAQLCDAAQLIHTVRGPLVIAGVGKSGHIAQKISATFRSLGKQSIFLHAAEASHGDLGAIATDSVVLVISNSGETAELGDLLAYCAKYRVPVIGITADAQSTLGKASQIVIPHGKLKEACLHGLAPTTSTTVALAIGDALAVGVSHLSNIAPHDFRRYHPGGKLGAQLLKAEDLMHRGDALPIVAPDAKMQDVVITMSSKGFGAAIVCEDDVLIGLITDGDMRRNVNRLWQSCAKDLVLGSR
ncbi:KpsF/GutQ family sugar-phosphate isomerase [Loktanella sp. D2R18]|uniref:KpsF/GutQ family sugar-phosphate isomerase n=1 Tax=Rhodobacterales TaxID=204455 RepID=UPI000DE965F4|nr:MULTISPECIES: KpsF/GutQ family sugar-phosphate isomerase [Rhodobacterales]MDO6591197.1 KpsF/GutQ family sugar-phosphate isomerase [Yoonia sp. 1_MG-2023]RBW41460.1 KpsF/GutQ family sugar-phosphate isomerase [Loktanella sp. D2R18]